MQKRTEFIARALMKCPCVASVGAELSLGVVARPTAAGEDFSWRPDRQGRRVKAMRTLLIAGAACKYSKNEDRRG